MLESKRLIFRKVEDDDFDVIAKMMRDEGVRRIWGHYFSDDDVRAWIERRKKDTRITVSIIFWQSRRRPVKLLDRLAF